VEEATIREASSLCHACSYLYLLESLYDGYYIVDSDLRVVIRSLGLSQLLPRGGLAVGERWSRKAIGAVDQMGNPLGDEAYPMHGVLQSNRPQCTTLKVPLDAGKRMELELHAIPMLDGAGNLQGVAEILRNESQSKKNPVLYRELRQAASQDPLTGVANRGELETCLRDLHAECVRGDFADPFSIIFIDIDHFKRINDTYEHATGDKVLINLVRLLEDELYSEETVGRYGGEEFVIVCPGTDLEHAVKRAERVRNAVQDASLGGALPFQVTASFGVAEAASTDTAESVLQRADQALLDAKRSGRNRTCFREPQDMTPVPGREAGDPGEADHRHGEFVHTANIVVCEAADMVVYKLTGFVEDHDARLLDVRNNLVGMQIGHKRLFGKWGSIGKKQPVELIVSIGDEIRVGRSATKRVEMEITVTPIGRPADSDTFHLRAARLLEHLRSYLLAD
jgi:diguanylate cyclase (GGDEF)-like protein